MESVTMFPHRPQRKLMTLLNLVMWKLRFMVLDFVIADLDDHIACFAVIDGI